MENRYEMFTSLIFKISRSILRIKTNKMSNLGLKSVHVNCIYYLYNSSKPLTATDIRNASGDDKALLSRAIHYLEDNGYLYIDSKSDKAYNSNIYLTEKGKEVGKEISTLTNNVLEEASKGLKDNEREILYRSLGLIEKNLSNIVEKE